MGDSDATSEKAWGGDGFDEALAIVHAALDPEVTTSLADLLRQLAVAADAAGCVLWEVRPPLSGDGPEPGDTLFVLESWFHDSNSPTTRHRQVFARHDLPIADSLPGTALQTGRPALSDDFARTGGSERNQDFPGGIRVNTACAFPASHAGFLNGALNFYRTNGRPFTPTEVGRLGELVKLIPGLYQAMHDRASLALLKDIEQVLQTADAKARDWILEKAEWKQLIQRHDFAERDERLPKVVADQIARCWSAWLSRREIKEENDAWRMFVEGMRTLNEFVEAEVDKEYPDEHRIFEEALRLVSRVVPGADALSVRVHDVKDNTLRHAVIFPRDRDLEGSRRAFQLIPDQPSSSAGEHVMRNGELYEVNEGDPYRRTDGLPGVRRMLIAPLTTDNRPENRFGVIDIGGMGEHAFPRYARQIAELLGRQLGMYHRLVNAIIELKKQQRTRVQVWRDLSHQLKSPILLANKWADVCLREMRSRRIEIPNDESAALEQHLLAIRGLCRKASRVTKSIGLLEDLANNRSIELRKTRLAYPALIKLLKEASMDSRIFVDPRRQIHFRVDVETFRVAPLLQGEIQADANLLEQAVSNILDNAGKYSHANTSVRIFGGLTNERQFHISVVNRGIRIAAHEIDDCVRRDWRSDVARLMTQEGSGIGLWVVDKIMQAHGGQLVVRPTTADDLTEFKLVFPATEPN